MQIIQSPINNFVHILSVFRSITILEECRNQKGMNIMKREILILFLMGIILLTACGNKTPLSEQKSITENKVGTTEQKDTQDIKTPVDKKTGLKLNTISSVNLSQYTINEELALSESPTATFILTTDSVLADFKIQSISYDGIKCEVNKDLYSKKKFDNSISLTVNAYIPETFSNLLISYKKDGKLYRYYVVSNLTGEGADANLEKATI